MTQPKPRVAFSGVTTDLSADHVIKISEFAQVYRRPELKFIVRLQDFKKLFKFLSTLARYLVRLRVLPVEYPARAMLESKISPTAISRQPQRCGHDVIMTLVGRARLYTLHSHTLNADQPFYYLK
jgi:hypothetical protein